MCEHFDKDYDDDYEEDENLDDDCEMEKRKLYDEEDDDIIFFFSPEYGYAEDEEDCDEDNNLQHENKHLDCAEKIASMICDLFELHTAAEEYVYLLSLDTKCRILGIFEVGHGTVNACLLHTRKIMIRNLLCGAGTFIVVHNHPSGEVSVSKEDISTTKRLFEAGRLIGIELLDHIIIGRKENGDSYGYAYYSMKEQGLLTTV